MARLYRKGDIVRACASSFPGPKSSFVKGQSYTVSYDQKSPNAIVYVERDSVGSSNGFHPEHFELVTAIDTPHAKAPEVYSIPTQSKLRTQVGGDHYKNMKIQPLEYILANDIPFTEGCVIKYVSRWRAKGGVEDLKKARQNLDVLIEFEEAKVS